MLGGFYRIAVASAAPPYFRGNAIMDVSSNRFVDYSDGTPWDAELVRCSDRPAAWTATRPHTLTNRRLRQPSTRLP